MTVISKKFADELCEKEMREAYLEEQTRTKIAQQIRTLRVQREWSQNTLGRMLGKPQSNIARLEDREIARYTLSTLFELASAFDVGLVAEFVSYEEFLWRTADLSQSSLQVPSFSRDALNALCQDTYQTYVLGNTFTTFTNGGMTLSVGQFNVGYNATGVCPISNTFGTSATPFATSLANNRASSTATLPQLYEAAERWQTLNFVGAQEPYNAWNGTSRGVPGVSSFHASASGSPHLVGNGSSGGLIGNGNSGGLNSTGFGYSPTPTEIVVTG